ncbi:MAG: hypothetical protein ABIK09_18180 [Pseudomonadota bacterium]
MRCLAPLVVLVLLIISPTASQAGPPDPFWAEARLWSSAPEAATPGPGERAGPMRWDPSVNGWLQSLDGMLVRVHADGRKSRVLDDVQGVDVDARLAQQVAVSREPDHRIVLHRWDGDEVSRRVLAEGPAFFAPRISPDGRLVLISESRREGGHVWVAPVGGGDTRDLGQGYGPAWAPDSRSILVARLRHDGEQIVESGLWIIDAASGEATLFLDDAAVIELEPAVSPDGLWLAFVDGATGEVVVREMPAATAGKGGAP